MSKEADCVKIPEWMHLPLCPICGVVTFKCEGHSRIEARQQADIVFILERFDELEEKFETLVKKLRAAME